MGRWSQSRRSGGGVVTLNEMVEGLIDDSTTLTVVYLLPVTAAQFSPSDFNSSPGSATCTQVNQQSVNELQLVWSGSILSDTSLTYSGDTPGVRTPQTISIS